ncbi:MAG TPA: FG-GAP-like repeat-containing protein, partial [Planctomycetota bacterium]|nr:FG-GAP-like repeat-containing protein [Planctomycetota bacterium]
AGDFDGDGYDDLLVTSRHESYPDPWTVHLYHGSPTGLPPGRGFGPPPAWLLITDWVTAASVGDVDGDGYDDILALELQFNDYYEAPNYVLHRGSPQGPRTRPQALVPSLDDHFPVLYPIGDLDGDSHADVIAVEQALFVVHLGSASGFDPMGNGTGRVPAGPFASAGDVDKDGTSDLVAGDPANERADVYRGGRDWSFEATADLAVQQVPFDEFGNGFDVTLTNAGPDPVRVRLHDPVPTSFSGFSWFCYHVPPGLPSGATATCLRPPGRTGDVDTVVTIAPGGAILMEASGGPLSLPVVNAASVVLPEGLVDPDLANNSSIAVVGPPVHLLFRDDFESGDLSAWSSRAGRGLRVTSEASLQGTYGLEATPRGRGMARVGDDSPAGEVEYHARFLFEPGPEPGAPPDGSAVLFRGR